MSPIKEDRDKELSPPADTRHPSTKPKDITPRYNRFSRSTSRRNRTIRNKVKSRFRAPNPEQRHARRQYAKYSGWLGFILKETEDSIKLPDSLTEADDFPAPEALEILVNDRYPGELRTEDMSLLLENYKITYQQRDSYARKSY